jgi:hypothetical protein
MRQCALYEDVANRWRPVVGMDASPEMVPDA